MKKSMIITCGVFVSILFFIFLVISLLLNNKVTNPERYSCISNPEYKWKNYSLTDKKDGEEYHFDTCVDIMRDKIVVDKKYGWKLVNSDEPFNNDCKKKNGKVYTEVFAREKGDHKEFENKESPYNYDHLYICEVKGNIINHFVTSNNDSKK